MRTTTVSLLQVLFTAYATDYHAIRWRPRTGTSTSLAPKLQLDPSVVEHLGRLDNSLEDGLGLPNVHPLEIFQERAHFDRDGFGLGLQAKLVEVPSITVLARM